jgi:aminoglycoside phosphotransferase (APT) family kinase protein
MASAEIDSLSAGICDVLGVSSVESLHRLTGGASRETWMFDANGESFVLQRVRMGTPGGLRAEPIVLAAAHACGVPVPELVYNGSESDVLERPFMIVRAVHGETIARKIQRDDKFSTARSLIATQLGRAAATLHTIPVTAVPGLVADDQVNRYQIVLDELGEPHPVFEVAFRWLEQHRPQMLTECVVHGDFRLGNMVVNEKGLVAVLDWELAHLGDPMEDLGWLCVRAWRFGGAYPVGGIGTYEDLFDAYESVSGVRPDASVVKWWEILGTLKWGIMCINQAQAHLKGLARSHELAAIGRRVCENEYDLIDLLTGESS